MTMHHRAFPSICTPPSRADRSSASAAANGERDRCSCAHAQYQTRASGLLHHQAGARRGDGSEHSAPPRALGADATSGSGAASTACATSPYPTRACSRCLAPAVHVTVAGEKRGQRHRPGVRFHTLENPPDANEIRRVAGVLATSPERTIVDSLQAGTQLEQIELAVRQSLERSLTTPRRLHAAAAGRPARVQAFINRLLR